jgi:hypothetical protein
MIPMEYIVTDRDMGFEKPISFEDHLFLTRATAKGITIQNGDRNRLDLNTISRLGSVNSLSGINRTATVSATETRAQSPSDSKISRLRSVLVGKGSGYLPITKCRSKKIPRLIPSGISICIFDLLD